MINLDIFLCFILLSCFWMPFHNSLTFIGYNIYFFINNSDVVIKIKHNFQFNNKSSDPWVTQNRKSNLIAKSNPFMKSSRMLKFSKTVKKWSWVYRMSKKRICWNGRNFWKLWKSAILNFSWCPRSTWLQRKDCAGRQVLLKYIFY